MEKCKRTEVNKYLSYMNMFWLFMIANVIGVLLEGVWTVIKFGRWESHVVTVWGAFNLLYGVAAVIFYIGSVIVHNKNLVIKFVFFALIADALEYVVAGLLEDGLSMRAWTYKTHMVNIQGRISLEMTIMWGIIGITYSYLIFPKLNVLFLKMQGRGWKMACIILTVFMAVNISFTALCMVRWSNRHKGNEANNQIEQYIDKHYDDHYMRKRFCEWWFIDEEKEFWKTYNRRR